MPTYIYRCGACQHVFEKIHKMHEPSPKNCEACHATEIEKLITNGQFILKGTGWYHDGYGAVEASSSGD